jgi:hypothetical protein
MADDDAPEPTPKKTRAKGDLPFSEDTDKLDGRAWNRKPLYVLGVVLLVVVVVVAIVLAGEDLSGDDGGNDGTIPTVASTTTTTAPTTTTTSTTAPPATVALPDPGDPCSPEEGLPDCIDPDGDGSYVYLLNGADCLAGTTNPEDCIDRDNDGDAGPAQST